MNGALDGRVVAIPGAAGSLGPHVARALAAEGAILAFGGRDAKSLDALATKLGLEDERLHVQGVDLLDPAATDAWAAAVNERFGCVDGVAHLVGGWRGGTPLAFSPPQDWAFLEALLVRTTQHVSRAFHAALLESGRGRFVLVSAKQAVAPSDANAAYVAAKAAAEAWTWALADGFAAAKAGATANVVAVNALVTPEMRAAAPQKAFLSFTDVADVAAAIAFICSDAAAKMNGQRLVLHG